LNELEGELITIEAINVHSSSKYFRPLVDRKGAVMGTPFLQTLELKVGARVMLTYNVDVSDCLTNGARGLLCGVERTEEGNITKLLIKFDERCQGARQRRLRHSWKYKNCTVVEKVLFTYTLSKKGSRGSNTAKIYQFPIVVCFSATAHKFQGQTIVKPNKAAMDLRTVFQAAMAYVMLSRVQHISQLFILECVPEHKLYACPKALEELERLNSISKNENPSNWEKDSRNKLKISFLNCQSLLYKIADIKEDIYLLKSNVLCLSETWLRSDNVKDEMKIDQYSLILNSVDRGRGLATYFKEGVQHEQNIKSKYLQLSKFSSEYIDIISVYRSKEGNITQLIDHLRLLLDTEKITIIGGDFNICLVQNKANELSTFLSCLGFKQLVNEATHIKGGHIDHVYIKGCNSADVELYSPYYTAMDHDALCISIEMESQ